MPSTIVFRKNKNLAGKELSANTVASFLVAQKVLTVPDLVDSKPMSLELLIFLNRERAIRYWTEMGWLRISEDTAMLTERGVEEVQLREAGMGIDKNGKKKSTNVDPQRVLAARNFIENGDRDGTHESISGEYVF